MDQRMVKIGPVELTEIKEKVEGKELGEEVLIFQTGSGSWIAYKQYVKINRASLCMEAHSSPIFAAMKYCDIIAWCVLICSVVFALIFYLPSIIMGVAFYLLWMMMKKWIEVMSIVTEKRDQRMIATVRRLVKADETSQILIELQQKRIEDLERQLNCSTVGK